MQDLKGGKYVNPQSGHVNTLPERERENAWVAVTFNLVYGWPEKEKRAGENKKWSNQAVDRHFPVSRGVGYYSFSQFLKSSRAINVKWDQVLT